MAAPAVQIQLHGAVGLLVAPNGLVQGVQQTFGRVEVHDEPLRHLDLLTAGHERVGVEREVHDDLLRRRRHAREVGVGGMRLAVVEVDLGARLLGGLGRGRCR